MLCDLFAGSGVVAAAMSLSRPVATVDVQEYSRVLCSAMLRPPGLSAARIDLVVEKIAHSPLLQTITDCVAPLIEYELQCMADANKGEPARLVELLECSPLATHEGRQPKSSALGAVQSDVLARLRAAGLERGEHAVLTRHFGGVYFSYQQALTLDAILTFAASCEEEIRDTLKAAALSTASALVNSVGKQFAQPIRPRNKDGHTKLGLAKVVNRDRSENALETYRNWLVRYGLLPRARYETEVLCDDYHRALVRGGGKWTCIYADPPYTRDHYSRFYHVLETMCLRDDPPISHVMKGGTMAMSRGMYRADRHQSPFCIRSAAPDAFDSLFRAARSHSLPLVLSYSPHESGDGTHPRVVSVSDILKIARVHYSSVELCKVDGATHNQLNRIDLRLKPREHAELLFKCTL
jgi:16S rRNA G966 N2-methylase RsmD